MEPPSDLRSEYMEDEKVKVFRAIETIKVDETIRGQYVGFLDEAGVAPASTVETFVATPDIPPVKVTL